MSAEVLIKITRASKDITYVLGFKHRIIVKPQKTTDMICGFKHRIKGRMKQD